MARNRARARLNLVSQGHCWGRCRVRRRALRVSRPAREKKRRRRVLVVTICSPSPMRAVQRARVVGQHLDGQPGTVGSETPRGEMVQADAVLEVSDGVFDLGVAAMVGLQIQGVPVPVGDEAVIAVGGEEGQLGPGRGLHPPDDEPHRRGIGLASEGSVSGLGHIGGALHPVGDGRPVLLGYRLNEIAQAGTLADGDGEADLCLAADRYHAMSVEAAVGPHRELSRGPGVAHPPHRLPQKVGGAPGGVGAALAQTGHQHVAGAGGHGQQRVIAPLAGIAVVARPFLGQSVGFADGGVQVDGEWCVARAGPSGPGTGQQLPAHPVQLAHVAPPEAAQEGAQGGRRLDHAPQHRGGPPRAQRIGVVDAVATGQGGGHQGHQLVAGVGPARGIPQVDVFVRQFTNPQAQGQGGGQQQPGIGHQAVIVEGNLDAVEVVAW